MAFTRAIEKTFTRAVDTYRHANHTVRTRMGIAGAVTLTATGLIATPALAAPDAQGDSAAMAVVETTAVGGSLAEELDAQAAAAQQRAAGDAGAAEADKAADKADKAADKADKAEEKADKGKAEDGESAEEAEESRKADTRSARSAEQTGVNGYVAPIEGGQSTTPYNASGSSWSSGSHSGIDFSATTGTSVQSVGSGTVVTAGWGGAYGNRIVIQHDDGRYTQYAHLSSIQVSPGQSVDAGEQIGAVGSTGNSTGPHLHFEVRTGPAYGSDVDPVAYLAAKGIQV